jgi:hypothetical protein
VRPQNLEEVFPCARGVSNRQDNGHFGSRFPHDTYPFSAKPCSKR